MKKKGAGRPFIKLDPTQIEQLAAINCSHEEIAAVLGCSTDTLERNYAAEIKKGRERGRMSLKRKMWDGAMSGNTVMQIWLSKQMLGYSDKQELKTETQVTIAISPRDVKQALSQDKFIEAEAVVIEEKKDS